MKILRTLNFAEFYRFYASRIRLPECSKLAIDGKNDNDIKICRHDFIANPFWSRFVSLVKFSYWLKLHVSIIAVFRVIRIFFSKQLTRNLEIGNTPVWVWLNIWRLGQATNTRFGTNVSNKMLPNAAKCQGYSFYRSWVIKGKQTGGEVNYLIHTKTHTHTQRHTRTPRLGLMIELWKWKLKARIKM